MVNIAVEKSECRTQMKLLRKQIDSETYAVYSKQLNDNLISYIKQKKPHAVKGFIPYAKEPNIWAFIHYCWQHAIPYIVPKCEVSSSTMRWYLVENEHQLVKGAYSILEPDPERCVEVFDEAEVVLVPALAVTKQGERLGYGGGYYDRFYERAQHHVDVWLAIAFDRFIVQKLPTEVHDFKCNFIVSNAGLIDCKVEEKEDNNGFYTF